MVEISVIMLVYNAEKYLNQALDSVLNQTFTDIGVLCIDDGLTDNSLEILYDFEKMMILLKCIIKKTMDVLQGI